MDGATNEARDDGKAAELALRLKLFCESRSVDLEDKPKFSTERAAATLAVYSELHGGEEDAELLADLQADLMHLCERRGMDFDYHLETARGNYDGEAVEATEKDLDRIVEQAESELRRLIDSGKIKNSRQADEHAAEVAGEVASAHGIEDHDSPEFEAIMSAVLKIAGEEVPGDW